MSCDDSKKPMTELPPVRAHELPNEIGCYGDHLAPGEKLLEPTYAKRGVGDLGRVEELYGRLKITGNRLYDGEYR